jgi:SpoVK/Ycf46/Vps4 family AAA+-type ATPase
MAGAIASTVRIAWRKAASPLPAGGRRLGAFLDGLRERNRPVFVIATAGNIDALPEELLRKGWFDEIFFVDLPTRQELKAILRVHLAKRLRHPKAAGDFQVNEGTLNVLAEMTEGFSGAELEQVVISALFEAYSEERGVNMDDFRSAIRSTVPLSVTQPERIRSLREWANMRAVAATASEDRLEYRQSAAKADAPSPDDSDIRTARGG